LKARREFVATPRATDRDRPGFERFTQSLQGLASKLGQFVEEQEPVMSQRHFTGPWW